MTDARPSSPVETRLAEIQARREATQLPPWSTDVAATREFEAHAAADVDWLLAEVERLTRPERLAEQAHALAVRTAMSPGEALALLKDAIKTFDPDPALSAAEARVETLLAEIDRLREIVNSQKAKPEYRALQRKARNDRHRADFLQRKADRVSHDLEAAREILAAALPIVAYVSTGRGYVDVEHYPDASARIVNGQIQDFLVAAVPGKPQPTEEER